MPFTRALQNLDAVENAAQQLSKTFQAKGWSAGRCEDADQHQKQIALMKMNYGGKQDELLIWTRGDHKLYQQVRAEVLRASGQQAFDASTNSVLLNGVKVSVWQYTQFELFAP